MPSPRPSSLHPQETADTPPVSRSRETNAPTIFLLLLVIAAFVFVGWWAFWGKGARAGANAILPPPPSLNDAAKAALKPTPTAPPTRPDDAPPIPFAAPDTAPPLSSGREIALPKGEATGKNAPSSVR